jgi:tyrosyl-DNA phosphodiesterase 2
MGRHLLQLPIQFSGVDVTVMTSHLESLKDYGEERVRQLKIVFEKMTDLQQVNKVSIFGGDLNIREAELKKASVPEKFVDIWEACGKRKAHQYSWDVSENDNLDWPYPNRPKTRYDRVFLSPSDSVLRPTNFELIGKTRLTQCGRFASDHWGLWMEFQVNNSIY